MPPPRRLWTRLVTGDGMRRTRLHTCRGQFAGFRDLPRCLWSAALAKLGVRQRVPWLGYRAVAHLARLARPDWDVLEWGSGSSTAWWAARCRRVVSVESDPGWHAAVAGELARRGVANVALLRAALSPDDAGYVACPPGPFDLVVIDGYRRDRCARRALEVVRPGGWVFLDNSDVPYPEHQSARATLLAAGVPGETRVFADLYPLHVQAGESVLVRIPG